MPSTTTTPSTTSDAAHAPTAERDALPAGTRFGELEVLRVLGVGGFGIVYLAQDHALQRRVALKEYMPSSLAARGEGQMVSLRSSTHSETYAVGLRSFVNEARLLAHFNHPSLVKVYRFWEQNDTAYMVMPYLQGPTLREVRRSMKTAPAEAWIRSVIDPLIDGLELLHREGVYHRDIAPDNILLPPGEVPVLLDFGAARRTIGDRTQTFTAILKPSYAPIEQYAEVVHLRQGPWTDVYALGAVVYYLLQGTPPAPATARAVQDEECLLPLDEHPEASPAFLAAIESAMAVRPADRPQSMAALRELLDGAGSVPPRRHAAGAGLHRGVLVPAGDAAAPFDTAPDEPTTIDVTRPMTAPHPRTVPTAAPLYIPPPYARTRSQATVMPSSPTVDEPPRRPVPRRLWVAVGIGCLALTGAVGAWHLTQDSGSDTAAVAPLPVGPGPDRAGLQPVSANATAAPRAALPSAAAGERTVGANGLRSSAAGPAVSSTAGAPAAAPAAPAPRKARERTLRSADVTDAAPSVPDDARGADRPQPAAVRSDEPPPRVRRGTAAAPDPAPHEGAAGSPRDACGSRGFLSLALCMEEQCEKPRFKAHPQCSPVREIMERRRRGQTG
jgi:serine/threonine protein kinase